MEKTPMTVAGFEALKEELGRLKGEERRKVVKAIEEARAHGDLSENAEYDAAKQAQGMLEGRIRDIESKLATAQVIDVSGLSGAKVIFGATIRVLDCDSDKELKLTIVGEDEADADRGLISLTSPLARSFIGKSVGDLAEVRLPSGKREYEILDLIFEVPDVRVKPFTY